jgi:hypothetical protein
MNIAVQGNDIAIKIDLNSRNAGKIFSGAVCSNAIAV